MCRGSSTCSELRNPTEWSRQAPLMPPAWLPTQLDLFVQAAHLVSEGDVQGARERLRIVRNNDLETWYIEHGQCSGKFRRGHFGLPKPIKSAHGSDPVAAPTAFEKAVFARDGYLCRYCGLRLVPKPVFQAFAKAVGSESFPLGSTNPGRHGLYLNFCAIADHIMPHNLGGRTNMDNLVTACWSCNYGKAGWTVDEIGIDDPRVRPPCPSAEWDGLTSLLPRLRAYARARRKTCPCLGPSGL